MCTDANGISPYPEGWMIQRKHWHFHRRLFERYGLVLGYRGFSRIVAQISSGKALLIWTAQEPRGDLWSVRIKGVPVYVLAEDECIITAYPPTGKLQRTRKQLLEVRKAARLKT